MSRGVWKGPFVEASLLKKVEKFKNNKKPIKINNSFLAKTSISATGYNRKMGVKIANIVTKFKVIFLKNL